MDIDSFAIFLICEHLAFSIHTCEAKRLLNVASILLLSLRSDYYISVEVALRLDTRNYIDKLSFIKFVFLQTIISIFITHMTAHELKLQGRFGCCVKMLFE